MLKFSVRTFYQPLFSIFPSTFLSLPKGSHTKKSKVKASSQYSKAKISPKQKAKRKSPKVQSKPQKAKAKKSLFRLQGSFISANRVEPQGGA
jgi:hypothetical protein